MEIYIRGHFHYQWEVTADLCVMTKGVVDQVLAAEMGRKWWLLLRSLWEGVTLNNNVRHYPEDGVL